uniref:Uncharacterized protein n=1 Tax=Anguilla anguilla TaxID=7936 RepID=A0A0E9TJ04_ANGAN
MQSVDNVGGLRHPRSTETSSQLR